MRRWSSFCTRSPRLVGFFTCWSHLYTLFWFQANQPLLSLLNAVCLVEKHLIPIYSLWYDSTGVRTTIYRTRCEHANHYNIGAVYFGWTHNTQQNEIVRNTGSLQMLYRSMKGWSWHVWIFLLKLRIVILF